MELGSKEFQEYADKANIPNSYRIWANCMWKEAQRQEREKCKKDISQRDKTIEMLCKNQKELRSLTNEKI